MPVFYELLCYVPRQLAVILLSLEQSHLDEGMKKVRTFYFSTLPQMPFSKPIEYKCLKCVL